MPLPRKVNLGSVYEKVEVNIYDIYTKEMVFSGSQMAAANFLCVQQGHIAAALRYKSRIKRKYAVRLKKQTS